MSVCAAAAAAAAAAIILVPGDMSVLLNERRSLRNTYSSPRVKSP
jgi:hypothetical protein